MSVVHDDVIIIGSSEFLVSTGSEGDLVALSRDGDLLASGYTNGFGNVNLELGSMLQQRYLANWILLPQGLIILPMRLR